MVIYSKMFHKKIDTRNFSYNKKIFEKHKKRNQFSSSCYSTFITNKFIREGGEIIGFKSIGRIS